MINFIIISYDFLYLRYVILCILFLPTVREAINFLFTDNKFNLKTNQQFPINFNSSLNLAVKYQYAVKAGDAESVSYLNFKIGFAYM